jgi:hypothetical protein
MLWIKSSDIRYTIRGFYPWLLLIQDFPKHAKCSANTGACSAQAKRFSWAFIHAPSTLFGAPARSNNLAAASTGSPQRRPLKPRSDSHCASPSSRHRLPHFSAGVSPTDHSGSACRRHRAAQPCAGPEGRRYPSSGLLVSRAFFPCRC